MNTIRPAVAIVVAAASLVPFHSNAARSESAAPEPGVIADYHGSKIDLSEGWSGAQACAIDDVTAMCFDSENEMDQYLHESGGSPAGSALLASCSTSTRLYAGTSFTTPVVAVTTRASWRDLSAVGFDNTARSYKIGACSTVFAANAGGGGSQFSAGAGTQASTMPSGWDKVISSLYLA